MQPEAKTPQLLTLERRIEELQDQLTELINNLSAVRTSAPKKVREGLLAFADGTYWDPGSGRGLYQYVSGSWVKL